MSEIHGRLLIGGMTLNDLCGVVELKKDCACAEWCGHLLIAPAQNQHLEAGRRYRLELDDGRAGQVVVTSVEGLVGQPRLRVLFDGVSALVGPRFEVESKAADVDSLGVYS
ncbi:MAG: hypothetical protein EXS05_06790 [Planctomycetaceae bacterium]|nr:hypothetical protein [Planctomycetaceae bacterium]